MTLPRASSPSGPWLYLIAALGVLLVACGDSGNSTGPTTQPLSFLSLFPDQWTAPVGDNIELTVTARDTAGADVAGVVPEYTSSDSTVALVDPDGRIITRGAGTATVHATAGGRTAQTLVYVGPATYDLEQLGPPRVLPANYIDLSKIGRISRFRSTVGHSYTDGSETCRSMKHYYEPENTVDWTSVDIYAPASGTILGIATDGWGYRIRMRPRDLPVLEIQIFHVEPDSGIVRNMWIDVGTHLGRHASSSTMSDIAMSIGPKEGGTLISYFDAMTDAVFALYQARGVASREAAIITEAERDADPVPCVGEEQFTVHGTLADWIVLN